MSVKSISHRVIGTILCRLQLLFWDCRDRIIPPKEDTILFVTHPDDETLFFHGFIKRYKPYVVVMTAGYSVNRLACFRKAMKYYGVRYRAYDQNVDDADTEKVFRRARHMFKLGDFKLCATHNAEGEYGHPVHKSVHIGVKQASDCPIVTPVSVKEIQNHPLSSEDIFDKEMIYQRIYVSELFCLKEWPEWVNNEGFVHMQMSNERSEG